MIDRSPALHTFRLDRSMHPAVRSAVDGLRHAFDARKACEAALSQILDESVLFRNPHISLAGDDFEEISIGQHYNENGEHYRLSSGVIVIANDFDPADFQDPTRSKVDFEGSLQYARAKSSPHTCKGITFEDLDSIFRVEIGEFSVDADSRTWWMQVNKGLILQIPKTQSPCFKASQRAVSVTAGTKFASIVSGEVSEFQEFSMDNL